MTDVSRLPKWAQTHIHVLERELADWKEKALAVSAKTPTHLKVDMGHKETPIYLPDHLSVEFTLDNGDEIEVQFPYANRGPDRSRILVRANRLGGYGELHVHPQVSNVLDILTTSPKRETK